jgi:predicted nucleic acid-binding protein
VIAYLDSSVLLRLVLGEPARLPEWKQIEEGVCSTLVQVECLRTLDRLHLQGRLAAAEVVGRRESVYRLLDRLAIAEISHGVLERSSAPLPMPLGTLDAMHLATAILWREVRRKDLVMATHDQALGEAARAFGFPVIGC